MRRENKALNIALAGLMGALTAAGAYLIIPLPFSPVPVTGQTFFVLLTGLVLGVELGVMAMGVYLAIGTAGFPVFAGGTGGLGILFGPTGGYIVGFIAAVAVTGFIARFAVGRNRKFRLILFAGGAIAGEAVIYVFGIPWLAIVADLSLTKAVEVGMLPFLAGDSVKAVAAISFSELLWIQSPFVPIRRLE